MKTSLRKEKRKSDRKDVCVFDRLNSDTKGLLVSCDASLKEYLVHLDKTENFIIRVLDNNHLFIRHSPSIVIHLQEKVDNWINRNSFSR